MINWIVLGVWVVLGTYNMLKQDKITKFDYGAMFVVLMLHLLAAAVG